MKKRLFTLSLAVLLFAGALTGLLVSTSASAEKQFDPDSYDYGALYVEGAKIHFSAMDHKGGDTVDPILATAEDGKQLLLGKINANVQTEWSYGDGYLEISTGSFINGNGLLAPVTEAGASQSYTVEYIFGTVDKGLPQTITDYPTTYRSSAFAYSAQLQSYLVGSSTFGTYYITDEGLAILKKQAADYQAAAKSVSLQAGYRFTPNAEHVAAGQSAEFDFAQTKELIANYKTIYEFLTFDYTNVANSRISKTVAKMFSTWTGDFDWRTNDLELFRMPFGDVRQLNFALTTSLDEAGSQYTETLVAYKDRSLLKTMTSTLSAAPLDELVLARDVGTRVYAVRIYDRLLTAEEMQQNHRADVFRAYRLDPAFYFEASETNRGLYDNVLASIRIGVDSKETVLEAIANATATVLFTEKNEYTSLYVQDGLLLMVNPMAETQGFEDGDLVTSVSDLNGNFYSVGSAAKPATYTDRALNLGLLQTLKMDQVLPTEGEYTVRILYANHFGTEHGQTTNQARKFIIGPADFRVNYAPPSVDPAAKGGVAKGYLFMTNGQTGTADWKNDFDITWSGGQKQPDLFAVDYGQMTDFTNEITLGTKNAIKIYKDGAFVTESSGTGGSIVPNSLVIGPSSNMDVYAILVYDGVLTEEELMQNHFADLMSYYQVDMTMFDMITDDRVKKSLYTALAEVKIGETTKDYLQSVLESFALTGGSLGVIKAEDYMTFEGIQSRIEDYASARALFSFNNQKIAELEKLGAEVEIGTILMPVEEGGTLDTLMVSYLPSIGEYTVPKAEMIQKVFYRKGELFEGLYGFASDEKRYFSATIPTLDPTSGGEALNQQYYMRAYIAVNLDGSNFVLYSDAKSDLFGDSVSIMEACDYFLFTGYAESEILASLAGEYAAAAAKKTLAVSLLAHEKYGIAELSSKLIQSARDGALEAKRLNDTASAGISIDMDAIEAMNVGPQVATSKVQAELYATIGIAKYEEAFDAIKTARKNAEEMSTSVYEAAINAGADEATAEKIRETACAKLLQMIGDVETYLATLEPLVDEMQTIINHFGNYTALLQLSKVFPSKASLFINGQQITRYTIITDEEHLVIAESLQKLLLEHIGNTVGVYNVDNKYVGSHYDYTSMNTIMLGLTDNEIGDAKNSYAIYGDGNCIYIEGSSFETVEVAMAKFFKTFCSGTDRQRVTLDRGENALLKQVYTPLISFNYGESYPAVRCDSFDAEGVWQVFLQKMQGLPDEITVIDPVTPDDIPDSAKNVYYVAQDGDDANGGTIDAPFATLEAALAEVAYTGGGTIYIRGGYYELEKTVTVGASHSGSLLAPLYISAYQGETVIFTSAKKIESSALKTVDEAVASNLIDAKMKTRLNTFSAENSKNVYVTYLDPSIYDYGTPASTQLYINGALSHTARYPDKGAEDAANGISNGRIKFTDKGIAGVDQNEEDVLKVGMVTTSASSLYDAHKHETGGWKIVFDNCLYKDHLLAYDKDVELYTYAAVYEEWHRAHYKLTLAVDEQGRNTMESDTYCQWGCMEKSGNNLYFYNAIEDLDANGEFYIDHKTGMIYIYSDTSLDGAEILLSASATKLLDISGASNVVVNGLTFTKTMDNALTVRNSSERVIIQNCTFSDIKGSGVNLSGKYCGILNSDFSNTTNNMVTVSGATNVLESSYNFIQNNHFHHPNEIMQQAISLTGVGAVVSHNLFDDTVIYYGAAIETILEYNEFNRGSQITYDSGPVYISGASAKRANHIRYNYIHDLNVSRYGIYLDDLSSGNFVYGNIVHYAKENSGGGKCVNLHNGIMNVVYNNIGMNADSGGILNNTNYYVKSIDGASTKGGSLAYRWEGLSETYFRYKVEREVYEPRFPIHVWHNDLMEQHLSERALNPAWSDTADKDSQLDKLEIFLRSPSFNVYLDNVMINCGSNGYSLADPLKNRKDERNLYFKTVEEAGFVDYDGYNFNLRPDSAVFAQNPNFTEIPFDRMGRTVDIEK